MERPSKQELLAAHKVFAAWLAEDGLAAERDIVTQYKAGMTTPEQVAEQVGLARGIGGAAALLENRISQLTE